MNSANSQREQLERLIGQALRSQPARRAPATLGDRVFAEITRRAALPWWRRGYAHWPMAARVAFMLALLGLVWALLALLAPATSGAESAVRSGLGRLAGNWPATLHTLFSTGRELLALAAGAVPTTWVYAVATAIGALYVALFGLGAATYRVLQAKN
jgi:hypothetical protein